MKPYISIVVASRNDGRDIESISRTQFFLENIFYQLISKDINTEIIIVEWNPPNNKKRLKETLSFNNKPKNCTIRIISVPNSIHKRYPNADKISLFQFIAKNTGIRRARGEYILLTNIDILISDEIIDLFSSHQLNDNLIRAVRFDIPAHILNNRDLKTTNKNLKQHILRAFWPWETENLTNNNTIVWRLQNLLKKVSYRGVFTNACGDFTLLPKKDWDNLGGYPEYPYHGVKIDGLLIYAALKNGIKQKILFPPQSIYHIDHPGSWTQQNSLSLQKKLQDKNIPFISTAEYNNKVKTIGNSHKPIRFNDKKWGLSQEKLPEFIS